MRERIGRDGVKRCFVALWLEEAAFAAHQKAADEAGITLSEHLRRLLHHPQAVGAPVKIGKIKVAVTRLASVQRAWRELAKLLRKQKTLVDMIIMDPPYADDPPATKPVGRRRAQRRSARRLASS
jgi:hypothetical protein